MIKSFGCNCILLLKCSYLSYSVSVWQEMPIDLLNIFHVESFGLTPKQCAAAVKDSLDSCKGITQTFHNTMLQHAMLGELQNSLP